MSSPNRSRPEPAPGSARRPVSRPETRNGAATAPHPLVVEIRRRLRAAANPAKSPAMQAYMKSAMPYYGVQTPMLRAITREACAGHPLPDFDAWRATVLELWHGARFREERYAAINITGHPLYREHQVMKALPLYEELIVTGAWWDLVNGIAADRLGGLLRKYPVPMKKKMLTWSSSKALWKRRSSIICQLSCKRETDLDLLYACITPSLRDPAFFIRKAIGWALRQYAWTDPDEVVRYVREHEAELSPLSKREALKNVGG